MPLPPPPDKKEEGPYPPPPPPHEKPGPPPPPPPHHKHRGNLFRNSLYSLIIATSLTLIAWLILYFLKIPRSTVIPTLIIIWVTIWAPVWIGLAIKHK